MTVTLVQVPPHRLLDFLERLTGGVSVGVDGLSALSTQQPIDRQAGVLTEDVPQGHVDTADGVVEHRTVAPVGTDE